MLKHRKNLLQFCLNVSWKCTGNLLNIGMKQRKTLSKYIISRSWSLNTKWTIIHCSC